MVRSDSVPERRSRGSPSGSRNLAALLLVALALVGLALHLTGGFLHGLLGGPEGADTSDAVRWLDEHEDDASRVADEILAGASVPEVAGHGYLATVQVRRWPDAVSFTLGKAGFKEPARGLCYSRSESPPKLGTYGEEPVRWTHLRGRWYAFAAE